jgi:hypothetical protein
MIHVVYQAHVALYRVTYCGMWLSGITEVLLANVCVTLEQACLTRNGLPAKSEIELHVLAAALWVCVHILNL